MATKCASKIVGWDLSNPINWLNDIQGKPTIITIKFECNIFYQ